MRYRCNICGNTNETIFSNLDRESGSCTYCGAFVRLRSVAALVSHALFNRYLALPDWPIRKELTGIGVSDWEKMENFYSGKVNYVNTQFHREPMLDIRQPDARFHKTADFVTCSDVMEHVTPPVQAGFEGLFAILKPGGTLILTVPWFGSHTVEHYEGLHKWKILRLRQGYVVANCTISDEIEVFEDPVFHGGPGQVLEMRRFGVEDLKSNLSRAGFSDIKIQGDPIPEFGINHKRPWSTPVVAIRPF